MKVNKRYYASVRFNEGDQTLLVIRAKSEREARKKLKTEYRLEAILGIFDTMPTVERNYFRGSSLNGLGGSKRRFGY